MEDFSDPAPVDSFVQCSTLIVTVTVLAIVYGDLDVSESGSDHESQLYIDGAIVYGQLVTFKCAGSMLKLSTLIAVLPAINAVHQRYQR